MSEVLEVLAVGVFILCASALMVAIGAVARFSWEAYKARRTSKKVPVDKGHLIPPLRAADRLLRRLRAIYGGLRRPSFAKGGEIPAEKGHTCDYSCNVPVTLSPGSYLTSEQAAKKHGKKILDALNEAPTTGSHLHFEPKFKPGGYQKMLDAQATKANAKPSEPSTDLHKHWFAMGQIDGKAQSKTRIDELEVKCDSLEEENKRLHKQLADIASRRKPTL